MQPDCFRARRGLFAVALLLGAAAVAGCNGGVNHKGLGGTGGDASVDSPSVPVDGGSGKPDMSTCITNPGKGTTELGQACVCHSDCASKFCADGVCCSSACGDKCTSCNLPGSEGTCSLVPEGVKPREAAECAPSMETSCGLDGTCNGMGGCRKHVLGTVCQAGICDGDGMSGINVCDGAGACSPGPAASCFPYTCAADKCLSSCTADKDCSAGRTCVGNSCGKLPTGRGPCTTDDECTSGQCADGVCCNVDCSGECVSCNQTGFVGQCRPLGAGLPHKMCAVQPRSSCGTTGVCDGFGSCALYPAETTCIPAKCAASMLNTAGTCDGAGACQPPGQIDCAPFMCAGESCVKTCTTDAECVPGKACVNGSCGKKSMGSPCAAATECLSDQCVDGVCCDSPCTGACQSCSLQSSLGQCKSVAAGATDPHGQCKDAGAASCGTNGKCEANGACRKYAVDTACSAETCVGGAHTPPATCNASGQCVAPAKQPCAPFACNGTKCFEVCSSNAQCVAPNTCVNGSCGLKPPGAGCSAAAECQYAADGKQYCAQGVCCNGACTTACQACNLSGSVGKCTTVANNAVDPQKKCATTAVATCGTNGKCREGVCDTYHTADTCKYAYCSSATTSVGAAYCDGRGGACPAQASMDCGRYICNSAIGSGLCKNSCTSNADCVAPNTCNNGSCGPKANGAACSAATQCASGICTEGVCCNTACTDATTGTCQSCKVAGKVGTCSPVAAGGADPKGRCVATTTACGATGMCNGSGACQTMAPNGTACNDGNPCTTRDACAGGTCGGTAMACAPSDQCHSAGTCDPATGMCSNPAKADGETCSDGNACTVGDVCTAGACAAGAPKVCPLPNQCHTAGTCNAATGACSNPNKANGTACNDSNACTQTDTCQAGVCTGANSITCPAPPDQCHTAGTCNAATGICGAAPAKPAGTACNDGNMCTTGDACTAAGVCAGSAKTCPTPTNPCLTAGTCQAATGLCGPATPNTGGTCTDTDPCTTASSCQAGVCVGSGTITCPQPTNPCKMPVGACVPGVGCPTPQNKPNGTDCGNDNPCLGKQTCQAGTCVRGAAVKCPDPGVCEDAGVCNPNTGVCSPPTRSPDGTKCSGNNMCCSGMCIDGPCGGDPNPNPNPNPNPPISL